VQQAPKDPLPVLHQAARLAARLPAVRADSPDYISKTVMPKLRLILALHSHQPVGNFDHVLEDSYFKAYLPFLETLNRYPSVKVVLHYSGFLLVWLEKNHPEYIEMLRSLIKAGRVEMLSGGFYEPILAVIPEVDRAPQIEEFSRHIRKHLGYSPEGMWLAERVWEPQMPKYISQAGIRYLSVDDHHFRLSGLKEQDLRGYYLSEDEGYTIGVFPGSEKLRYLIPFGTVDKLTAYLREISGTSDSTLITMADDLEKFGVWPETYKHCYEDGWLNRFFRSLTANETWVQTTTFKEYFHEFPPSGRVYLPAASYREMGEWALPCEGTIEYEHVLDKMQLILGDSAKGLLRGGIWRSFFAKYQESNHIHKRMLQISKIVHEATDKMQGKRNITKPELRAANALLHELWKGQCNDAYWHGIFGGLYLPHLRSSLYRHLLTAEREAEDILKKNIAVERSDFDCDGRDEVSVSTPDFALSFSEQGGSLLELSLKEKAVNILDILSRRSEAYHEKILHAVSSDNGQTKTIHDQIRLKEADIKKHVVYDNYRRASLIDRFFTETTSLEQVMRSEYTELGDFIKGDYAIRTSKNSKGINVRLARNGTVLGNPVSVEKTIRIAKTKEIQVRHTIEGSFSGIFATEFNISLLGSPEASIVCGGKDVPIRSREVHDGIREFLLRYDFLNLSVAFEFDEETDLWHYPVETISMSEQGMERLYQGTCFLFAKRLNLNGKHSTGFAIRFLE
jgi:alpha-amylase